MFDTWTLILGLIFSSIGLGYFIYGGKQKNVVMRYSGLALIIYPYFIYNVYVILLVGFVLMALPKFIDL